LGRTNRYRPRLIPRKLDDLHVWTVGRRAERFPPFDERQAKLANAQGMKTS
jgi:hypothetical protein